MTEQQVLAYVKAAAAALELPLGEQRELSVAMHLARTAALAAQLDAFPMDVNDEPAEIYSPAPFPLATPGHNHV